MAVLLVLSGQRKTMQQEKDMTICTYAECGACVNDSFRL